MVRITMPSMMIVVKQLAAGRPAAARRRLVQELRGPVAHRLPGRERRGDAWQDRAVGARGGAGLGRKVGPAGATARSFSIEAESD